MTNARADDRPPQADQLAQMVAEADTGGRTPNDRFSRFMLMAVPLAWALFQLWYASPLPYQLRIGVFNATEARSIHLAFAIFLAFMAYPAFKHSPRNHIPISDWLLALGGAFCAGYLFLYQTEIARRPGQH